MDFSRPVELHLREQDLRLVIGDVLALAAEELSTRNVRLASAMPKMPLIAKVDADLLKQAALNVIQNGAQAMPQGGLLAVALEEERSREQTILASKSNGLRGARSKPKFAVLRIADEGEGIPAGSGTKSSTCISRPRAAEAGLDWR